MSKTSRKVEEKGRERSKFKGTSCFCCEQVCVEGKGRWSGDDVCRKSIKRHRTTVLR